MKLSKGLAKIASLALLGFILPFAMLFPVYLVLDGIGAGATENAILHLLPPAIGCSFLFALSAIVSTLSSKGPTFVQSLFLIGTTFIVVSLQVPRKHYKSEDPQIVSAVAPIIAAAIAFLFLFVFAYFRRVSANVSEVQDIQADGSK
jgi:hypothetical protein